jgi:hypothetical protein
MQLADFAGDDRVDIAIEGISGPDMEDGGVVKVG